MEIPTLPPLSSDWKERLANIFYRLRAADGALQIEKDGRRQIATEHAIVQAWKAAGHTGKHPLEDEEVAVSVGDTINYNAAPTQGASGWISTAGKMLAGAALLGAGAGGAYWLGSDPQEQAATTPPQVIADRDTQYQFRVVPELSGDRGEK